MRVRMPMRFIGETYAHQSWAARASVEVRSFVRRKHKGLTRMDQIWIMNLTPVGFVNDVVARACTVGEVAEAPEAVAGGDGSRCVGGQVSVCQNRRACEPRPVRSGVVGLLNTDFATPVPVIGASGRDTTVG